MKTTKIALTTLSLSVLPSLALAHSGHDHASVFADLIHFGFYAAPVVVAAAIGWWAMGRRKSR